MRRLLQSLTTGYMLMFFSENVFWGRFRPGEDNLANYAMTWLAYSLLGYVLLALVRLHRVRSAWALFLAGAAVGWLAEGVLVQTAYDQFPLQLSWTGLAWHALISVVWGWYGLRKTLLHGSWRAVLVQAGLFGLFAGGWAITWWLEEPGTRATPLAYGGYSLVTGGLFALSCVLYQWVSVPVFEPGRRTLWVVGAGFAGLFALVVVGGIPWALLVLPPLMGLVLWGLRRNRQSETAPDLLEALSGPAPRANALALLALPLAASLVYSLAYALGLEWPTNWLVYLVTTPAGFVLFGLSLVKMGRGGRQAAKV